MKASEGKAGVRKSRADKALPEGWREVRLGDVCTLRRGGSPRPIEDYLTKSKQGINWLRIGDIAPESKYVFKTKGKIKPEGLRKSLLVKEGDFILSNSMSYGRPYIMKVESCIHDGWLSLSNIENSIHKNYLYYVLLFDNTQNKFNSMAAGSGVRNLKIENVSLMNLTFPPIFEQKSIASLLETWDTAIEKTEALIAAKEKQFKWLLKTLITDQQNNPEWRKVKLEDICFVSRGQGLSKKSLDVSGKHKCILYGELYTTYSEIIDNVVSATNQICRTKSKNGDVLIPSSTTTSGIDLANATALLEDEILLGGDINILRTKNPKYYSPSFLAYTLTHAQKYQIARYAQGITIIHLYGKDIKRIILFLPTLHQQKRIVAILNKSKQHIRLLRQLTEQYRTQKRGLMQKLLTGKWRTI